VSDGVFDERLHDEGRHRRPGALHRDVRPETKAIAETDLFDTQVLNGQGDFTFERDSARTAQVQAIAQELP